MKEGQKNFRNIAEAINTLKTNIFFMFQYELLI